ncbi:hypothetical protein Nepgr_010037 [Nepenthes gracilis]|uniref:G-patch domain-containing protein n=1 Tax=Nepenthes gracilis TaxID=150966 RepID=A0AAD3SBV8_NEPGR|nr:hypothetical protein Nepgr_010037 [Nepenthes gracilis]
MAESIDARAASPGEKEEDDDYMGDLSKFIPLEAPLSSKSRKIPRTRRTSDSQPSKNESKSQNPQAQRRLDMERKLMEEDQRTLENLESAIPQSNIGFKLLKQMGYTPGSALGKEGSGRAEPLGIDIRRSRAGIGREDPLKEKFRREKHRTERKRKKEEELMEEFGSRQKGQWRNRRILVNYHKAKTALDQLENREFVEPERNEDDEKRDSEEEEEVITEEDLQVMLMQLREEHCYCLFCGCQYESAEALLSNCPGDTDSNFRHTFCSFFQPMNSCHGTSVVAAA